MNFESHKVDEPDVKMSEKEFVSRFFATTHGSTYQEGTNLRRCISGFLSDLGVLFSSNQISECESVILKSEQET